MSTEDNSNKYATGYADGVKDAALILSTLSELLGSGTAIGPRQFSELREWIEKTSRDLKRSGGAHKDKP